MKIMSTNLSYFQGTTRENSESSMLLSTILEPRTYGSADGDSLNLQDDEATTQRKMRKVFYIMS